MIMAIPPHSNSTRSAVAASAVQLQTAVPTYLHTYRRRSESLRSGEQRHHRDAGRGRGPRGTEVAQVGPGRAGPGALLGRNPGP